MNTARTNADATAAGDTWTRHPHHVRRRAGRAIWDAAESEPDPLAAIDAARRLAADLLDRLTRTAADGEHLATCFTHSRGAEPGLAADLALSRRGRRCLTDRDGAGTTFGGLLVLGALTGAPVGMVLRSCRDPCHTTPGHESTARGWVVRERRAHPLSRGAVRTVMRGGRRPHPALPQHPEEGTKYETAYSLYLKALTWRPGVCRPGRGLEVVHR